MEQLLEVYTAEGGILLFTCLMTIVTMNPTSRLSVPIPNWYREKLGEITPKVNLSPYIPQKKPDNGTFMVTYRTTWSDLDFRYHVNHTDYIRMAIDAASEACFAGKLPTFTGDFSCYHIQQMNLKYSAVCFAGELLNIFTWVDENSSKFIHCQIERAVGGIVVQAMFNIYRQNQLSRL